MPNNLERIADNSSDEGGDSASQRQTHMAYQSRHEASGDKDSSRYNSAMSLNKEKPMSSGEARRNKFRATAVQSSAGLLNVPGGQLAGSGRPNQTIGLDAHSKELDEMLEKEKTVKIKSPWRVSTPELD